MIPSKGLTDSQIILVDGILQAQGAMIAAMLENGIPLAEVKAIIFKATGMNIKAYASWRPRYIAYRDCLIIRKALKAAGELK